MACSPWCTRGCGPRAMAWGEQHHRAAAHSRWLRGGHDITYTPSARVAPQLQQRYYTLTWSYACADEGDELYFAHCYPYTYTNLLDDLHAVGRDAARSRVCRQRVLCRTLAGNVCHLLTITSFGASPEEM